MQVRCAPGLPSVVSVEQNTCMCGVCIRPPFQIQSDCELVTGWNHAPSDGVEMKTHAIVLFCIYPRRCLGDVVVVSVPQWSNTCNTWRHGLHTCTCVQIHAQTCTYMHIPTHTCIFMQVPTSKYLLLQNTYGIPKHSCTYIQIHADTYPQIIPAQTCNSCTYLHGTYLRIPMLTFKLFAGICRYLVGILQVSCRYLVSICRYDRYVQVSMRLALFRAGDTCTYLQYLPCTKYLQDAWEYISRYVAGICIYVY